MLKRLLQLTLLVVMLLLVSLAGGYVVHRGDYPVLATVSDDSSLPAIDIDGVKLHAEAFGEQGRPVLIVLHGGPGNDYRMLLSLKALSDDYRVVFYDQRGAGLSERVPIDKLSIEDYVKELDSVARHYAGAEPVHLVGHSWGAMLAAAYLGRHPDRVASAVLAEPGFLNNEQFRAFMDATDHMGLPMSVAMLSHLSRTAFQSLHVDGPDDDARMDWFMMAFIGGDIPGHPLAGYYCDHDVMTASMAYWRFGATASGAIQSSIDADGNLSFELAPGLSDYPGPVLLIASACNTLIGEAQQRQHLELFINARLEVVADSGHTMFGEQPRASLALVRAHLAQVTAPPEQPATEPLPL